MSRLLLAAAATTAATAIASCGISNPLADPSFPGASGTAPAAVDAAAERVAADYAVAARTLDPPEILHSYRRQLGLAGPPLRDQLIAVGPPTDAEIRELARDRARTAVAVLRTQQSKLAAAGVVVTVQLEERAVSTGTVNEREATYRATVSRTARGRWLVTTFTAEP